MNPNPTEARDTARASAGDAARLLWRMAAPERRTGAVGIGWLILAAALEAIGPLLGKHYIDHYLLPGRFDDLGGMGLLLAALLATGVTASLVR